MADALELLAGPACLGRSVLVAPGQPAPGPWKRRERLTVRTDALEPAAGRVLRQAWRERRPLVIEIDGPIPNPSVTLSKPWWKLSPGLTLKEEVWHFLLTANAVDARDPSKPRFAPVERALVLGAARSGRGASGDVIASSARSAEAAWAAGSARSAGLAWCDGGPLDVFEPAELEGAPLICAASLAAGSLAPLRPARPAADLAPDQQAATGHLGGGACIVAPAGSGKTRVLTERVRYLVRDLGVAPQAVCLVAFNVRARAEMQQRTEDLPGLQVRTLNSLALAICNGTGAFARPERHRRVDVINEPAVRALLSSMAPKKRRRAMTDVLAPWLEALSASRLGLHDLADVERAYAPDVTGFVELAPAYAEALERKGAVDFDHQIIRAIEVLLSDVGARAAARRACGVLLVDEFQDLTPAHLLLIRLLAGPRADVFGVGDDDQTIYGFTGASPEWLIGYDRYFPGADRHFLRVNYRCPPAVVEAASNLLSRNRRRVPKEIAPAPSRRTESGGPRRTGSPTGEDAADVPSAIESVIESVIETDGGGAEAAAQRVRDLVAGGVKPSAIAVLTRVNSTLLAPQLVLRAAGIDCDQPVGAWFLARTGVAAALAWLRLALAPRSRLPAAAILAAAKCPPLGISPRVREWVAEQSSVPAIFGLSRRLKEQRASERVAGFARDVKRLRSKARRGATTLQLLEAIRDLGLGASLDDRLDASRRTVDRSAHGDDLRALLGVARLHEDPAGFEAWLAGELSRGPDPGDRLPHRGLTPAGQRQADASRPGDASRGADKSRPAGAWGGGVRLATVHRVKGLQWPHVIVFGASEGLMPHRLAADAEEERRVFHVAVTRCSKSLLIVTDGPESPYVSEMRRPDETAEPEVAPHDEGAAGSPRLAGAAEGAADRTRGLPSGPGLGFGTARGSVGADKPRGPGPGKPQDASLSPEEKALFERLREWRLARCRADSVPAYVVFSDKVLVELARRRPVTGPGLLAVPGIGPAKLAAYGEDLKRILAEPGESTPQNA